ncbi:3-deoxy-7-phosphoheptulonate synthase [Candidatus Woesearchaeota archaeon]|nr:3-deoxy-7-phosphoheptulonate synthase [Candidatus Woesearchaeota archaeon]
MVIVLKNGAHDKDLKRITDVLESKGLKYKLVQGEATRVICVIGDETKVDMRAFEGFPGVERVMPVGMPFKLLSRKGYKKYEHQGTKSVDVNGVKIGGKAPVIIAGPCAIESEAQALSVAKSVKEAGADLLRGGAYKPRTSPYEFQGLQEKGLEILEKMKKETGLGVVTEVMDPRLVQKVSEVADMLQIGARNMQNYNLLIEAGKQKKPVLLKRHPYATLKEWLLAAEYIAAQGNAEIVLCERGIRSPVSGEYDRSTLDLNVIPGAKKLTYLPVIVDPSHSTGHRDMVPAASKGALSFGADGLLIEVLRDNESPTACDYNQGIFASDFKKLMQEIRAHKYY